MIRSLNTRALALGLVAACALVAPVNASMVDIGGDMANSTSGLCDFEGSIQYDYLGGDDGKVIITLANITAPDIGGYITGFVFNVADFTVDLDLTSTTHPDFLQVDNEPGNPFGSFRSGAALGGNFLGGGSPVNGVAVGDTGVFEFDISSTDASLMSANTFLEGANEFNFLVRFRGLIEGGSDKVPGGDIPAPGAAALLGLAGLTAVRRRRA